MPDEGARRVRWILCLWPGLPQLWLAGAWSGLALAVGFASLLDLLLLTTLLWTEWVEPAFRFAGWTAVTVLWSVSIVTGWRWSSERLHQRRTSREQDLFPRALGEYLRGNWYEAEAACKNMLRRVPGDVQARLLLAGLLRRTRRWPEAHEQLAALKKLEASAAWEFEIADEEQRLSDAREQTTVEVGEGAEMVEPAAMLPAA
ncbi:MAG TPA: tetratricopeptide repeat protein [Pirellulales bacterium]|nr:tetratricopeptide repeat protein [Pirellulales bacterium]